MKLKRILSLTLAAGLLSSLLILPAPAAAAGKGSFNDVSGEVAEAVETLRALGIVSGAGGGSFLPGNALTRAEFCKMAVELMGKGDLVAGQMSRTVFKDVPATHWARGYISVATQTSSSGSGDAATVTPGIIRGDAYGKFNPDRPITYAEAVTILVRILGYGDKDVGPVWPDGYLSTANSLKLTDGVKLTAGSNLTRGQAALLLENLLYINPKDSKTQYLAGDALKCTISDEAIIFSVSATAPDGSTNAVKTNGDKLYTTDRPAFPEDLVGRKAKMVLDADGKAVAAQVSDQGTQQLVSILSAGYNFVKLSGGSELKVSSPAKVTVYRDGAEPSTYDKAYLNLGAGSQALFQYSASGELEYVFLRGASNVDDTTRVLKNKPTASASEPGYQILKNGLPAATKDYRQYDVLTFDTLNNIQYVSDLRVTGVYENVYPNPQTPAQITLMGRDFDVLPSAATDLARFKPGQTLTLLLTYTGQVAGAVEPSVARSTTVGQVTNISEDGKATVIALNLRDASGTPMVFEGLTSYTGTRSDEMLGQVVTISSGAKERLSLSKLSGSDAKGPLDVKSGRVGATALAANALLYEHVDVSNMRPIDLEDITMSTVPKDKITYVHKNFAGDIDLILFNDVTGDLYDYGKISHTSAVSVGGNTGEGMDDFTSGSFQSATVTVENDVVKKTLDCSIDIRSNSWGGIVARPGDKRLAAYVALQEINGIRSADFDTETMTVTTNSAVYPISSMVLCYNRTTGFWYSVDKDQSEESCKAALDLARAYSSTMTVYMDKAPEDGGKIRIVVVG